MTSNDGLVTTSVTYGHDLATLFANVLVGLASSKAVTVISAPELQTTPCLDTNFPFPSAVSANCS